MGNEFWTKAETLLYCALIGYIHYEVPAEEQNFATLIEFINAMEVFLVLITAGTGVVDGVLQMASESLGGFMRS